MEAPDLYRTLDLEEAAEYLRVHPETMRALASSGQVRGRKPGRAWVFVLADLVEFIRGDEQGWRLRNEATPTGSTSQSVDAEYKEALGLETGKQRKSTTTRSRRGSGGKRN